MRKARQARVCAVEVSGRPSRRLLRALAVFGLAARRTDGVFVPPRHLVAAARHIARVIAGHGASSPVRVLLLGASGCGKSTLLRELGRLLHERGVATHTLSLPPARPDALTASPPVIDLFTGPLVASLGALARAGLGDARLLGRTPDQLSEGERFRLSLALATAKAAPGTVLLCDEFMSCLDRPTAQCVSMALARWAERTRTVVVCATPHEDISEHFAPTLHAQCTEQGVVIRGNSPRDTITYRRRGVS